jgi:hypothetical protein
MAAYLVRLSRAPLRVIDRIAAKVIATARGACIGVADAYWRPAPRHDGAALGARRRDQAVSVR